MQIFALIVLITIAATLVGLTIFLAMWRVEWRVRDNIPMPMRLPSAAE